ncbi:MAG: hypothetical protein FWF20_07110 [Betaproteobacteria bacterium]|nr:hypothetical protein [Betaproteobacteria bacterium]MCL2886538.1 hypothetical protein [Betaproteobacteria bacterium]
MAYLTGTANSLQDLQNAFFAGLQSAGMGWSVDVGSGMASKGAINLFAEVVNLGTMNLSNVRIQNRNLIRFRVNDAPIAQAVGDMTDTPVAQSGPNYGIEFPCSWHLHVNTAPDEMYFFVGYNITDWQWFACGCSSAPGITGTGVWASGTKPVLPTGNTLNQSNSANFISQNFTISNTAGGQQYRSSGGLFWTTTFTNAGFSNVGNGNNVQASVFHSGMPVVDANHQINGWTDYVVGISAVSTHVSSQPNAWNAESLLIPIRVFENRPESKWSIVGELRHCRYFRIDNHAPTELIALGTDQWRVYPWFRKDLTNRNGGQNIFHTGTFGCALRV